MRPPRRLVDVLRETLQRVEQTTDADRDDPAFVEWKRSVLEWIAALEQEDGLGRGREPAAQRASIPPKPPLD
jgi:hypothetical protein